MFSAGSLAVSFPILIVGPCSSKEILSSPLKLSPELSFSLIVGSLLKTELNKLDFVFPFGFSLDTLNPLSSFSNSFISPKSTSLDWLLFVPSFFLFSFINSSMPEPKLTDDFFDDFEGMSSLKLEMSSNPFNVIVGASLFLKLPPISIVSNSTIYDTIRTYNFK